MNKVVTIGREFGSGGRELGRRLAALLGFAYYDKEIITEIAKRTELSEQYVHSILEHKPVIPFSLHVGTSFQTVNMVQLQQNNAVYTEQCNILKELCEKENCVIVGRCADYILSEYNPFRIFVYADMESKIKRCREMESEHKELSDKELKKKIRAIDKHRAKYYNFYTGLIWGDKLNYDICINTSKDRLEYIAPYIAKLV